MRIFRTLSSFLVIGCLALAGAGTALGKPLPPPTSPPPGLGSAAAILMDWQTGQVLFEKGARQRRDPASTTKVLTALVVLERANLSDQVAVSRRAAYTPGSSMGIRPGEVHSVHDLLHGLLLRSGNDAAVALAEHVSGSVEAFALLMNQRARELGARQTHFTNPHGLTDANHHTTAYDLALIAREALRNPWFANVVSLREQPLTYEALDRDVVLSNTNRLLYSLPGADGVKTGTTSAAGACLIASATRDEHKLITVVLRASNRWNESARLLEWGFSNYRLQVLGRKGEVVREVPVSWGRSRTVPVLLAEDAVLLVPRSMTDTPTLEVELAESLQAPLPAGAVVGRANLVMADGRQRQVELVTAEAVSRSSVLELTLRQMAAWIRALYDLNLF